ncbi:unnamed protein product [Ectocarpus sp. 12 AP-2014]
MIVGILGQGEIGSSLHGVYTLANVADVAQVVVRDPPRGRDVCLSNCDIVNVCIPYLGYDEFVQVLRDLGLRAGCVVIIQSTVAVGCTDRAQEDLPSLVCVHSPVRGQHPALTEGLLTFEKYVGMSDRFSGDEKVTSLVTRHITTLGMEPVVCRAKESELAKLVSTTLYGMNIAAVTDVSRMCQEVGVDFEKVFTRWQTGYNAGYMALGKPNVRRPVLTPILTNEGQQQQQQQQQQEQVIGGHCVLPNCVLLTESVGETDLSGFVMRYSSSERK